MLIESVIGAGLVLGGAFGTARWRRRRLYADLDARIAGIVRQRPEPRIVGRPVDFSNRLASCDNFLDRSDFERIRAQGLRLRDSERNYMPTHKKGGTVAYETLIEQAPAIVELYHSQALREVISRLTGVRVQPTPIHDQSSLSLLFYEQPGDHIGWHYDHNFYRGRHFTVLIPLLNEGSDERSLSHAQLIAKVDGAAMTISTPPNRLIVFEGAAVHHKVTPILEGERRLMLSMTFCVDPRARPWQAAARRIKDVAFFGPRALWT